MEPKWLSWAKDLQAIAQNGLAFAENEFDIESYNRIDEILLVKEKSDGGWTLPGGWADPNETPGESVEREVFEESGFLVKAEKILAVFDRTKQGHTPPFPFHVYKIFFLCKLILIEIPGGG